MTLQDGRSAVPTLERPRCSSCGQWALYRVLRADGEPLPVYLCEQGGKDVHSSLRRRLRGPARVIPAASSTIEPPPGVETSRTTGRTGAPRSAIRGVPAAFGESVPPVPVGAPGSPKAAGVRP